MRISEFIYDKHYESTCIVIIRASVESSVSSYTHHLTLLLIVSYRIGPNLFPIYPIVAVFYQSHQIQALHLALRDD